VTGLTGRLPSELFARHPNLTDVWVGRWTAGSVCAVRQVMCVPPTTQPAKGANLTALLLLQLDENSFSGSLPDAWAASQVRASGLGAEAGVHAVLARL